MDEQTFQTRADAALSDLYRRLAAGADQHEFEVDYNAGTVVVEFEEPPAKFVVSPNSPVRQIWVSAHSRSFKLGWDEAQATFVLQESGQTLAGMMAEAVGKQLGEEVSL